MAEPAFTRMDVDERRQHLLDLGTGLFTRHAYNDLSMAAIAREAGISKALLYHYFPSKRDYFLATVGQAAEELARRTAPDPSLPPWDQLRGSLDAYLELVGENSDAYVKLLQTASSVPEISEIIDAIRGATANRILEGLAPDAGPEGRVAVRGWLWFMDGALLDWAANHDLSREELRELLVRTLRGALGS
jgi:AcrR family transcriptional regulator